ncbi:NUDIX domain-containing protein [Candidatus Peregrinibacteria bacterium]|nr:NUDIX domain-containing protein [Candidatus Peregrinibacteria bacterium]
MDEISAGIVLFYERKGEKFYLLLKYPGSHFDFPKGHLEKGETELAAAIRELEEETGISGIEILKPFREEIYYTYEHNGKLSNKMVSFFLAKTSKKSVTLSHEHHDFVWLPYEKAHSKITYDNSRKVLEKAHEFC